MPDDTPLHLLTVWNPAYARNAMEEHLAILLDWAARHDAGTAGDDDLYVWWGKVRSQNRQTPQAHADEIRAIGRTLAASDGTRETHLYLTDYRSLYVGELLEVVAGDLPAAEHAHLPGYYREESLNCDFWFRLADVRRLVHDDLPAVIDELRKLRNTHYNDRPVSLYGGMVDLPLVVTRPDGARFFDLDERDAIIGGKLWAEHDVGLGGGTAAVERTLREDLIGEVAWARLELAARTSLATGERLFREHRNDPGFDFGPVIVAFSKALEIQCNAILRSVVRSLPKEARLVNLDGRGTDLAEGRTLMLGQIEHALTSEQALANGLAQALENGRWFVEQLPHIIGALRGVRNPGTHESRVDRRTAAHWRNRLLGVGCLGEFVELSRVHKRGAGGTAAGFAGVSGGSA